MIQYEIGVQTVHKYYAVRLDLDLFDGFRGYSALDSHRRRPGPRT